MAALGARSPKRVLEATSFEIRRFELKNTSSRSRLALRRGHGPAPLAPEEMLKQPKSCTCTTGSAVIGHPLRRPHSSIMSSSVWSEQGIPTTTPGILEEPVTSNKATRAWGRGVG